MSSAALRLFIVDDEAPARSRLRDILADCAQQLPLEIVGEATNGRETLEQLPRYKADVVLLDIRMPEMDGIEVARHLSKLPEPPGIIFTTAYDEYAVKAFELHAIDYLLKPVRQARLLEALKKGTVHLQPETLRTLQPAARTHLSIHERGKILLIPIPEVIYLKAELKYVTLRTAEREYLLEESLVHLEEEFPAIFVRIHRNTLVAKRKIAGFERALDTNSDNHWVVVLEGIQEKLPVSRRQWVTVKSLGQS